MANPLYKKSWFLSTAAVAIIGIVFLLNKNLNKNEDNKSLEIITSEDTSALADFYREEESKPAINPPIADLNIPYTTFKVDAKNGGEFDYNTGSKFIVPKNSFVDENGKPVNGEVELRYREFHDAVDFFVSGIPMTYDSAGITYQFESAGMMEMLAFQDGKKLNMAPEKSIRVELASKHAGTEYNLYKLDEFKNNWSCLGKDKVQKVTSSMIAKSEKPGAKKTEENPEFKIVEAKKAELEKTKEKEIIALPKILARPIKPLKVDDAKYTFNIEVEENEFPELAVFKDLLFEVGPENKTFSKALYAITWDEATLKEGNIKGQNYLLTLKKASKKYEFVVYPVFEGKDFDKASKEYDEKFKKYTAALDKRIIEEKKIEADYQVKLAALNKQQKSLEQKMKAAAERELAAMETEDKVKRLFAINSFGVYNCDNPIAYPKGISASATLLKGNNEKIKCYDVFLVDRSKNALFTFSKNPVVQFSYDPQASNILWTVENGILYCLKQEEFSNIKVEQGRSNIELQKVEQKFKTAEEMKAFFNL